MKEGNQHFNFDKGGKDASNKKKIKKSSFLIFQFGRIELIRMEYKTF